MHACQLACTKDMKDKGKTFPKDILGPRYVKMLFSALDFSSFLFPKSSSTTFIFAFSSSYLNFDQSGKVFNLD